MICLLFVQNLKTEVKSIEQKLDQIMKEKKLYGIKSDKSMYNQKTNTLLYDTRLLNT